MADHSQSGEQEHILAWADRHGPGRFLDIGAADGVSASNSRALALRGWPGVCVEPAAWLFDRLAELYRDRNDVECVQAAVVVEPQPLLRFHYARDLVSTSEQANRDTWADAVSFTEVAVAAVTVAQLLEAFPGPYDFVSVDTEGTSIELFHELHQLGAFAAGALVCVEAENGLERRQIQEVCKGGWARIATTANNVLLERL